MKCLRTILTIFMVLPAIVFASVLPVQTSKHRVFVLTDIENEPDDAESLVRFLSYTNQWDVEGLVATTSTWQRDKTAPWRIKAIITAYGKVRDNLLKHEAGFPTEAHLHSVTKSGLPKFGMSAVGEGQDSSGSDWLIQAVDKQDARPVWLLAWGGTNVLAQALWKVRNERTPVELLSFVKKLRVYAISDQDDSGPWLRKSFPDLFYIVSPGEEYRHATWAGISGDTFFGFATGADTSLVQNPWLKKHIMENHGPLGAQYPPVAYTMEGDTPSFLSLINNGLNDPEHPNLGGWGGRYELYTPRYIAARTPQWLEPETRPIWTDVKDEVVGNDGKIYISNHASIWRWRQDFQHDFAARMDWTIKSYAEANHPPVVALNETEITLKAGESYTFDASASSDPDGDTLEYKLIPYPEAGDYWNYMWEQARIDNPGGGKITLNLSKNSKISYPTSTQFILSVTDSGEPSLTRYKRIVVNIKP